MTPLKQEFSVAEFQSTEISIYKHLSHTIPRRHMIDVGAHLGSSLLPFLQAGWEIDAFEPFQANRLQLEKLYGEQPNVRIHSEAVSSSSGYKDFHLALKRDGELHEYYHSLEQIGIDDHHRKGDSIRIKAVALDDLIRAGRLPYRIGFLKIDTEGHDLPVLQGASLLEADVIGVEFWGDEHPLGKSPSPLVEVTKLLDERGYRNFLALCRRGEETESRNSLPVPPDSWGNAFFFRGDNPSLYEECNELVQMSSFGSQALSRTANILQQLLPGTDFTFVDIGACLGDFSEGVLEAFPSAIGLLFEPRDVRFRGLKKRFSSNPSVQISNLALSNQRGSKDFFMAADPAATTKSLPSFETLGSNVSATLRQVETLDHFLAAHGVVSPIALLKIGTQRNDVQVLEGATQTVAAYRPHILVTALFIKLYEEQSSCDEIFQFMRCSNYVLAGILEPHSTQQGLLAFADFLFVSAEKHAGLMKEAGLRREFVRTDSSYLLAQNRFLQATCDERLELIQRLNATAEERLKVIEILDAKVKTLSRKGKYRLRWF